MIYIKITKVKIILIKINKKGGIIMSKNLVAYFSASGITKSVAEKLAKVVNGDLYEITPEKLYTDADLDWMNKNSRSSVEMKDKTSRPAITGKIENMENYNVVFVGFPIWWYVAPTIINTFLESYDFSGKIVIPFATSGGSEMGNTLSELKISCSNETKWKDGKRFSAYVSEQELKKWVESLNL